MADSNFPTDFFEDKFYEKKGRKPQFLNKYSAQRILPYIRVPVEYTVILGIIMLVLMVISYAVGVEKGKRTLSAEKTEVPDMNMQVVEDKAVTEITLTEKVPETVDTSETGSGYESTDIKEKAAPVPSLIEIEKDEEKSASADKALYTLQLASFKREKYAKREAAKLKKNGEDASYIKKGVWYQVFLKGYETIGAARKAKDALIQEYPDCYIRKQKQ